MSLLDANPVYKPFRYPWAYEAWLIQQRIHWLPEEVPLAEDVKDWQKNISDGERNLLMVRGAVPGHKNGLKTSIHPDTRNSEIRPGSHINNSHPN